MNLSQAVWRKSTRSAGNTSCVEVTTNLDGVVAVRDSKDPAGPALAVPTKEWRAFVTSLR